MKKQLDILHEDDDLIVLNKPAHLLSIPDRFDTRKPNLYHLLQRAYGDIFTVHRLDKETSGVICFAKNEKTHQQLSQQFQDRTIKKIYHAIVDGRLSPKVGQIDAPLAPHPSIRGKMIATKKGKPSLTTYECLEEFRHFTYVEAQLETGRMHQARVHFKSIGSPLAIDALYGRRSAFMLSEIKRKKYRQSKMEEERPLMSRTTLHAHQLGFQHPISQAPIQVQAPLHKDFKAFLNQLRKWDGV